jgi:ADP-ribosylglycohydrolase
MTDCKTMERTARTRESTGQLACLLGGAIGDALGYRVEFDRWPEIERRYGSSIACTVPSLRRATRACRRWWRCFGWLG